MTVMANVMALALALHHCADVSIVIWLNWDWAVYRLSTTCGSLVAFISNNGTYYMCASWLGRLPFSLVKL